MTEAMMTEKHVETSAEEITQPSKMEKNVPLSRSQNWYVGVVLGGKCTEIHFHLFDYVGLVSSYSCLDASTVPSTRAHRDTHASVCESRRLFCTYQKLIEKQETKIAKQILENIGYGLGVTP